MSNGPKPDVTPGPGQSHQGKPGVRQHGHNQVSGIPAPWVTQTGITFQDEEDDADESVAIPATNRPVLTLTALPTTANNEGTQKPTPEATPSKSKKTWTPRPTPSKTKKTKTPEPISSETHDDEDGDSNENPEVDDD